MDLEEILLELSQNEVTHIWECLQAWADEQMTAYIAKEEQGLAEAQEQRRGTDADDTGNANMVSLSFSVTTICFSSAMLWQHVNEMNKKTSDIIIKIHNPNM